MADDDWNDDGDSAPVHNQSSGTSFGMGRGFGSANKGGNNNDYSRNSSGFGTLDNSNSDDRRPGGSFKSRNNYNNGNDGGDNFGDSNGYNNDNQVWKHVALLFEF